MPEEVPSREQLPTFVCDRPDAVPPDMGAEDATIAVVGEAPGPDEARQGRPFVGRSGKLLRSLLAEAGVRAIIHNVVCHHPVDGQGRTRTPTPQEVAECSGHTLAWLAYYRPRAVLAVGAVAARVLGFKGSIGQVQGRPRPLTLPDGHTLTVVACYHPAYALRSRGNLDRYRQVVEAIRRAIAQAQSLEEDRPDWRSLLTQTRGAVPTRWAVDTETSDPDPNDCQLVLLSAYSGGECPIVLSLRDAERAAVLLRETLSQGPVFHNSLFDLPVLLRHLGLHWGVCDDTQVMAWLIRGGRSLSLKTLAEELLGISVLRYDEVDHDPDSPAFRAYAAQDAVLTRALYDVLRGQLRQLPSWWYYETIARRLLPILGRASAEGFLVDHTRLRRLEEVLTASERSLREFLAQQAADPNFNPASPQQVAHLVYNRLGLECPKLSPMGSPSTDEGTLRGLLASAQGDARRVLEALLGWRRAYKLLHTYVLPMRGKERVHTYYQLTGTETGRLSSSRPNLQNLPPLIKGLLRAPEGWLLVVGDYSQAELRAAACLSGDPYLLGALAEGRDLHAETAQAAYGHPPSPAERAAAKSANFARLYGSSLQTYARVLGVPLSVARRVASSWSGWERYAERTTAKALSERRVYTVYGRHRELWVPPDGGTGEAALLQKAAREAVNATVQGSVADITNYAIVLADGYLRQLGGRILHQEHDSIIGLVPDGRGQEALDALRQAMREAVPPHWREQLDWPAEGSLRTHWSSPAAVPEESPPPAAVPDGSTPSPN